ncbi:MAG: hypothetical protein ACTSWP_10740 [Candidatus Freyarchaeota archaeon]
MDLMFGAWIITLFYAIPTISAVFGKPGHPVSSYIVSLLFIALYEHYAEQGIFVIFKWLLNLAFPPLLPDQIMLFLFSTVIFAGTMVVGYRQKKALKQEVVRSIA